MVGSRGAAPIKGSCSTHCRLDHIDNKTQATEEGSSQLALANPNMDTLRRSKRATMARSNLKEGSPSAAAPGQRGASPRWRGGGGFLRARRDVHADPLVALREEKRSWDGCSARCRSRRSRSSTSGARCGPGSAPKYTHFRKLFRLLTHRWPLVRSLGELGKSVFHIGRGAAHITIGARTERFWDPS